MFQNEMNKDETDNFSQMWGDNFEVVYSQFRTKI